MASNDLNASLATLTSASADASQQLDQLTVAVNNVDLTNPASMLQVQLALSQYESAVSVMSQTAQAMSDLTKTIVQNIK